MMHVAGIYQKHWQWPICRAPTPWSCLGQGPRASDVLCCFLRCGPSRLCTSRLQLSLKEPGDLSLRSDLEAASKDLRSDLEAAYKELESDLEAAWNDLRPDLEAAHGELESDL